MGPCQGGFCSHRLAAMLFESERVTAAESLPLLKDFLEERWKGIRPILWGSQLREEQLFKLCIRSFLIWTIMNKDAKSREDGA